MAHIAYGSNEEEVTMENHFDPKMAELEEYYQHMFAFGLVDSAAAIASTLDIDTVMQRILINVGRVVPNKSTNIMLIDRDAAYVAYWRGFPDEYETFFRTTRFSLDIDNLKQMLLTDAPVIITDTNQYPDWINHTLKDKQVKSYIGVPIRSYDQIIGFLNLGSDKLKYFTPTHAERLRAFADQVAIAIANAETYNRLQHYTNELEQRVAERTSELVLANEHLRELDWLRSKLIADISHELRTPLTSLNLLIYLLEKADPEQYPARLKSLRSEMNRLNELVNRVVEFSNLDAAKSDLVFDRVDINKIIVDLLTEYRSTTSAMNVRIHSELETNLPAVCGNSNILKQVIASLLENSISYTPVGDVYISTRTDLPDNRVCLTIQDTGTGIDPEDRPHIFEPFYRGKHVGSSNIPGAGLGLSFVKEMLEHHEGCIDIESRVNEGTVVRVWLPLADINICSTSACGKKCSFQLRGITRA